MGFLRENFHSSGALENKIGWTWTNLLGISTSHHPVRFRDEWTTTSDPLALGKRAHHTRDRSKLLKTRSNLFRICFNGGKLKRVYLRHDTHVWQQGGIKRHALFTSTIIRENARNIFNPYELCMQWLYNKLVKTFDADITPHLRFHFRSCVYLMKAVRHKKRRNIVHVVGRGRHV